MNTGIREEDADVTMEDELEYESDVEADLEVDELDSSGSDQENSAQPSVSTSKKAAPAVRPGIRVPGTTLLPQVRIENILQADGVTGHLALSKEGQFILSCATEEFIKRFAQAGLAKAKARRKQTMVTYNDMGEVPWREREFRFLRETVPQAIALSTAWELRGMRKQELMEEDPALGGIIPPGSFHHNLPEDLPESAQLPSIVVADSSSKRKKNGDLNGHSASAAVASSSSKRANPEITSISTSGTPLASSSSAGSKKNGSSSSAVTLNGNGKEASTALSTPSEDKDDPMLEASEAGDEDDDVDVDDEDMPGDEPPWSNPTTMTGPASGYLQGPGTTPFGRTSQDSGRTIYSQKNQPD